MKKVTLLLGLLVLVSTINVEANSNNKSTKNGYYYNEDPISFKERGIKFYIFPDGELDFNIHANEQGTTTEYYYKQSRNESRHHGTQGATKVVRDYRGRVIQVGRVFINYNYMGKVSRVGSVFISYRRNLMTRVGNLRIIYDRYGNIRYIGKVKNHYNSGYYSNYYYNHYHDYYYDDYVYNYNDDFFYDDDFEDEYEYLNEDDTYYYYRSKSKISKRNKNGKMEMKPKLVKRKKSHKKELNKHHKKRKRH